MMLILFSSGLATPKTLDLSGMEPGKVEQPAGAGGVQMRAGGKRGQPSKILQERLRSVVQSQLITDTTPQAAGNNFSYFQTTFPLLLAIYNFDLCTD